LDHDDEFTEHALAMAVLAAADHPGAGIVYSDEDKIDETGRRFGPFFKPDFDPLLLLGQNYLCHMTMMRRDLVQRAGGYQEGTEGSQDWDLILRLVELLEPEQIVHAPHILYHWRAHSASTALDLAAKPYAVRAGSRAVSDHLRRRGLAAEMITNGLTGVVRVKWRLPETAPKVSIVIPTRDGAYLRRCVESIFRGTGYGNYEVVVVDNGSLTQGALDFLRGTESWVKVVRDERSFNYSALNNAAVAHCSGEVLCLLNDDCEVVHYDWLEEMVSQLLQDGVGAVGAKLLYGDGRVQHGGVILGVGGVAGHAHRLSDRLAAGHFSRLYIPHSLSAVTAACMVVRRSAFEQVGGLDEVNLPIAFNDVDFCLRLREAGWRVVWTPFAELTHFESVTRGPDTGARAEGFSRETGYMQERWGDLLRRDPAYNPNLTLEHEDFSLAFPPRVTW
jgi:GT2 family glycosyltransferase